MPLPPMTPDMIAEIQRDWLDPVNAPREFQADGIVAITMDARFRVTNLTVSGIELSSDDRMKLEQATLSCVNDAIEATARLNAERFTELMRRVANP